MFALFGEAFGDLGGVQAHEEETPVGGVAAQLTGVGRAGRASEAVVGGRRVDDALAWRPRTVFLAAEIHSR